MKTIYNTTEPTSEKSIKKINTLAKKLERLILDLNFRWQQENGYEDINEYANLIKKQLPKDFIFVEMKKKPFGFKFSIEGKLYHIFVNHNSYGWNRVTKF